MNIKTIIFLACLTMSAQAQGSKEWSKTDIGLEVATQILIVADWNQTSQFHKEQMNETNWAMGHHPRQKTINRYFLEYSLGHLLITNCLSGDRRRAWQLATITIEAAYVNNNIQIGCHFHF